MNKKQRYLTIGGITAFFALIIIAMLLTVPVYRAESISVFMMQQLDDGRMIGTERKGDDIERYVLQDINGDQRYITAERYENLKRTVGIDYRRIEQSNPDPEQDVGDNPIYAPGEER